MSPFKGALNGLLQDVQKCPRSGSRESPAWTQAMVTLERTLEPPQVGQFTDGVFDDPSPSPSPLGRGEGKIGVEFRLSGRLVPHAQSVTLAGSFNEWNAGANPMRQDFGGDWVAQVPLPPGTHAYLYLVDGICYNDPADDGRLPSVWGTDFSVKVVRQAYLLVISGKGFPRGDA